MYTYKYNLFSSPPSFWPKSFKKADLRPSRKSTQKKEKMLKYCLSNYSCRWCVCDDRGTAEPKGTVGNSSVLINPPLQHHDERLEILSAPFMPTGTLNVIPNTVCQRIKLRLSSKVLEYTQISIFMHTWYSTICAVCTDKNQHIPKSR